MPKVKKGQTPPLDTEASTPEVKSEVKPVTPKEAAPKKASQKPAATAEAKAAPKTAKTKTTVSKTTETKVAGPKAAVSKAAKAKTAEQASVEPVATPTAQATPKKVAAPKKAKSPAKATQKVEPVVTEAAAELVTAAPDKASSKATSKTKKPPTKAAAKVAAPAKASRAGKVSQPAESQAAQLGSEAVVSEIVGEAVAPEIQPSKAESSKAQSSTTQSSKKPKNPAKSAPKATAKAQSKATPQKATSKKASSKPRPEAKVVTEAAAPVEVVAEAIVAPEITEVSVPEIETAPVTTESTPAEQPATEQAATQQELTELITAQLRKMGRPVHIRDFERSLTRQAREKLGRDLGRILEDLTHSGVVICTRRNTYGLPEAMNLVRGRFQASASGFGFVIPDSGGDDFYIREGETLEAWNGDTVLVRPEGRSFERSDNRYDRRRNQGKPGRDQKRGANSRNDSARASVVRIVTRAYSKLVGSLEYLKGYAFLKPDDHRARHRIMLVQDEVNALAAGSRVVTQLFWPEETGEDEVYGEVVRVLGAEDDAATETQAVIIKYGLHDEFSPEVLAEAEQIPNKVPAKAIKGRLDLREYNIFTVDGSDAKDFDDAIHIKGTPEGNFEVGIHIADVSHYVQPGTALDAEAYDRATSVYLPGSVLPMLPEHLSNGVCSLVPYEDRLTMSAIVELSGDGDILSAKFAPSVIRSKARLTYDEVQAYSEASATLPEHARALEGDLHLLLKLTAKLRQKRLRDGSLDFKMREVKVDIGKDGHMQIIPLHEETARGMIEDLMLLANKTVAHFLLEKNVPTLYRIHEEPTLGRFQETSAAIGRMGLSFPGGEPTPQSYQAVLKAVRGTPQESVVNTLLLRSMQQAKYAEENLGHFGLAFEEYLHFTSPIRRYPDLLVHRALKLALAGDVSDRERAELAAPLTEQGRHTSERERNAAEAERDLTKYYQCKWAEEHLNETFEGRVSGVIASGLFVALENGVEGRLHISNLDDDYYVYIEEASILKGRSNGRSYRIGDSIYVNISKVNPLARQIDFAQENNMDGNDPKPRARRREDRERETQKREKLSNFLPQKQASAESGPQDRAVAEAQAHSGQYGHQKQGQFSGVRRDGIRREDRNQGRSQGGYSGGSGGGASGSYRRRVITLERPRNEHLRPVNITVQRMYFGDWTLENMPPEDSQSERSYRSSGGNERGGYRGRSSGGSSNPNRPVRERSGSANRETQPRDSQPREARSAAVQPTSAPATADASSEEAKRRRRRRGRRGGAGGENSGNASQE